MTKKNGEYDDLKNASEKLEKELRQTIAQLRTEVAGKNKEIAKMKAQIQEHEKELKEWHRRAPDIENMEA